jgi:hypothetical protein
MKKYLQFILLIILIASTEISNTFAAELSIEAPKKTSANREPFYVVLYLDAEGDTVSGLSGDFSFPSILFDVKSISTQNGIVPLWMFAPHVSEDKTFDGRTHIMFEGMIPGGYHGNSSPYYEGVKPGVVLVVGLLPKEQGRGSLLLDSVELHAYDENASLLPSHSSLRIVDVPKLSELHTPKTEALQEVKRSSFVVDISRNENVNANAWYIFAHDSDATNLLDHIVVAETDEYDPRHVSMFMWHTTANPYVVAFQARSKYIHVKGVYADGTYSIVTLPPVENSAHFLKVSRILISIVTVLFLIYHYGFSLLRNVRSKNNTETK